MEDILWVWIDEVRYTLYRCKNETWRLFYGVDRFALNINGAHILDYWRRKGVLNGEEEKGS